MTEEKKYFNTCFGRLHINDINESGLVYDKGADEWLVPTETKFAEETEYPRKKGDKYQCVTDKFFRWYNKRNAVGQAKVDNDIDEQIRKAQENNL